MWRGHVAGLIDLLGAGAELPPTSNPTGGAHVQIAVGIDTGKTRRQAAAHEVEGARWVGHLGFSVGRAGFDELGAFLQGLAREPAEVLIGLEATGHYHLTLVEYLTDAGYQVVILDPYRAAQFRRSERQRRRPTASMLGRWPASWRYNRLAPPSSPTLGSSPCAS